MDIYLSSFHSLSLQHSANLTTTDHDTLLSLGFFNSNSGFLYFSDYFFLPLGLLGLNPGLFPLAYVCFPRRVLPLSQSLYHMLLTHMLITPKFTPPAFFSSRLHIPTAYLISSTESEQAFNKIIY